MTITEALDELEAALDNYADVDDGQPNRAARALETLRLLRTLIDDLYC